MCQGICMILDRSDKQIWLDFLSLRELMTYLLIENHAINRWLILTLWEIKAGLLYCFLLLFQPFCKIYLSVSLSYPESAYIYI